MTILDFKSPDQDKTQQVQNNETHKWRRSGDDRRDTDSAGEFFGERRRLKGRRTRWLKIISSVIFPRESKLK